MLVVVLTACAVSPPSLPVPAPPPGFAQTSSLSTPTVDVPSEPSLGEADSEAAQNGNNTASPAGRASGSTHATAFTCTGSAQGVPTWWLNVAVASWNLRLVLLACILVVVICCCLGCFCKRCVFPGSSRYPLPPPYPYPYPHGSREQHAYQHRERPRPPLCLHGPCFP